jgi:hypothetical protein
VPVGGTITLNGALINQAGQPIRSISRAANTVNLEVQAAGSGNASDRTKNGLAHFDSDAFTVDADGFVSLIGGGAGIERIAVQAASGGGTNPVLPNAGTLTINGTLVAQQSIPIRTISTSANTLNTEVQISTATAASDITKNGFAHFNSANFNVDANGFVSSVGAGLTAGYRLTLVDDFIFSTTPTFSGLQIPGQLPWQTSTRFPFVYSSPANDANHPGVVSTVALNSSYLALIGGLLLNNITLGAGDLTVTWVFFIDSLSNSTNRYDIKFGCADVIATPAVNGIFFQYSDNLNSGRWVLNTVSLGISTQLNTAVPVTTGWHVVQFVVNPLATSVAFYIDGVLQTPITTNIPTTDPITPYWKYTWVAGVMNAGTIGIDLMTLQLNLINSRF